MRKRLLVATRNPGKTREFRRLLNDLDVEVIDLEEAGVREDIEETGATFEENARAKAEGYARLSGELTLADDSGLEVDALGGRPGVMSARYGGPGLTDADRVTKLLAEMKDVRGWKRTARFTAVLALAGQGVPGGVVTEKGVVEGAITHQPIGSGGFGYDPVFWIAYLARTSAELTGEQKDAISHRGAAARKMLPHIRKALSR
jgi:XTP/dITP diphosphohydrolase